MTATWISTSFETISNSNARASGSVEATIRAIDSNCALRAVTASRGKVARRAEPVAALYEQGRIFHRGPFDALEDEMAGFTSNFDRAKAGFSPRRVDALVWAVTDLILQPMNSWGVYELYPATARRARSVQSHPQVT